MADKKSNHWSRVLDFPVTGADKKRYARVTTDGSGVYVTVVREDKDGEVYSMTFFPEHMHYFTDELPDLIRQAKTNDLRIMKQNAKDG